ncbi:MAG: hypothetical protein NC406_00675, partial [Bacteroides sp.]|nr:hypothetical protein [Bacteroides sp.]MCM1095238.1 hypothetical protein [Terasakiella sp.]
EVKYRDSREFRNSRESRKVEISKSRNLEKSKTSGVIPVGINGGRRGARVRRGGFWVAVWAMSMKCCIFAA